MASLLLCLVLCSYYSIVHGGGDDSFVTVPTSSFEPNPVCSQERVHRHGPCAPSPPTDKPTFADTLCRSRARLNYTANVAPTDMRSHGDVKASIPTHLGSSLNSLEYVVTVSFGTPAVSRVVVIDTGSDLSWLQCKPCNPGECTAQKDPLYDPSHSSTYSSVPCSSDPCKKLTADVYSNGCTSNGKQCGFLISYADGTSTSGVYSKDKLTLAPGVVHTVSGLYDGLLGLGRLSESLGAQYGGTVSYCLPAVSSKRGFLALGSGRNPSGFQFTPMGTVPGQPTFATVKLAGITIGGKKLNLRPSAFEGGMIVDSGSIITGLPSTAYGVLRSAFREAMQAYRLVPNDQLDTCYDFKGHKNIVVPKISLTFSGGATINLHVPNGILVNGCLAFADSGLDGTTGVLGNVNQRTFEVLFDTSSSKVGFRANAC
ncbi:hypothetical protein HU200_060084 [Digitaria exilis]|uniref:Peptidase A1 domain-containing protein n=1 Tax=Digitaria exilis TaxID=1010633 RepID=A0A835E2N0_9POAL|nr:hypothetical protein HU200_060084 [Digitaria exilis]